MAAGALESPAELVCEMACLAIGNVQRIRNMITWDFIAAFALAGDQTNLQPVPRTLN